MQKACIQMHWPKVILLYSKYCFQKEHVRLEGAILPLQIHPVYGFCGLCDFAGMRDEMSDELHGGMWIAMISLYIIYRYFLQTYK